MRYRVTLFFEEEAKTRIAMNKEEALAWAMTALKKLLSEERDLLRGVCCEVEVE